MLPLNDLFTEELRKQILSFYETYEPAQEQFKYRALPPKKVKTLFYGASHTNGFRIQEFFPGASFLNRGIPGDTLDGLYARMDIDVFPYEPEQVVILAGTNGIHEDNGIMLRKFEALGDLMAEKNIRVFFSSIPPIRHGDRWNRFQFQDKIVELNAMLRGLARRKFAGYVDYHSVLRDEQGELRAEFAREDGTHVTFEGYRAMAEVLKNTVELY